MIFSVLVLILICKAKWNSNLTNRVSHPSVFVIFVFLQWCNYSLYIFQPKTQKRAGSRKECGLNMQCTMGNGRVVLSKCRVSSNHVLFCSSVHGLSNQSNSCHKPLEPQLFKGLPEQSHNCMNDFQDVGQTNVHMDISIIVYLCPIGDYIFHSFKLLSNSACCLW